MAAGHTVAGQAKVQCGVGSVGCVTIAAKALLRVELTKHTLDFGSILA
jgi:hypothetical protein